LADTAEVCALLCSDEARFFTGHALSVDGGSSLMNSDFPLARQLPGNGVEAEVTAELARQVPALPRQIRESAQVNLRIEGEEIANAKSK
jgi:hypothetical protein